MKKGVSVILLAVLLIMNISCPVKADNDILVNINGEYIQLKQNVRMINNRTMLPMRALFEYLGASVEWDNDTNAAIGKLGNDIVNFTINSKIYVKNDEEYETDVPAMLIDGHTYLPGRAVSEALGYNVEWNNDTRTVYITNIETIVEEETETRADIEDTEEEKSLPKPEIETYRGDKLLFYVQFFIRNTKEYEDDTMFKITYIEPEELNEFDLPNMWTKGWDRYRNDIWFNKSSLQDNEHRTGSPLGTIPTDWYTTRENIDKVKIYDGMPVRFKVTVKSGDQEQDFFYEEKIIIDE